MYVYGLRDIIQTYKQLKCAVLLLSERVSRAHGVDAAVGAERITKVNRILLMFDINNSYIPDLQYLERVYPRGNVSLWGLV